MARIALVLGSGGARGYAHIGAIEVLEERGHEIVTVAGSSMGALVGGLHVAGKLGDFTVWAMGLKQFDVWRLMDPAVREPGLVRAQRVTRHLSRLLDGIHIEEATVPYTAVATDLRSRREVWFQRGPMDVAIRASIAMPSFITPVLVDDRLLIDGGVVNPVPVEPTLAVPADHTIAVNLNGPSRRTRPDPDRVAPPTDKNTGGTLGYLELVQQTVDLMSDMITRYRTAGNAPDVVVPVPHDACRVTDFHRAEEMVTLGRRLTTAALDRAGL